MSYTTFQLQIDGDSPTIDQVAERIASLAVSPKADAEEYVLAQNGARRAGPDQVVRLRRSHARGLRGVARGTVHTERRGRGERRHLAGLLPRRIGRNAPNARMGSASI